MRLIENFTAGVKLGFSIPGNYFSLESLPAGTATVEFFKGDRLLPDDLRDVVGGWYARPAGGFDRVEITCSDTQAVIFYIARGEVGSNVIAGSVSLLAGSVDVLSLPRTDVNIAHGPDAVTSDLDAMMARGTIAALAANFSCIQLKNPDPGAGVVYVDKVTVGQVATARNIIVGPYDPDLTTNIGVGGNKWNGVGPPPASLVQVRSQNNGALFNNTVRTISAPAPAGNGVVIKINPPIALNAGFGLVVQSDTVNLGISASFEYREYS